MSLINFSLLTLSGATGGDRAAVKLGVGVGLSGRNCLLSVVLVGTIKPSLRSIARVSTGFCDRRIMAALSFSPGSSLVASSVATAHHSPFSVNSPILPSGLAYAGLF